MKILCVSDEENKAYWDYFRKEKLEDIDLILSAGDLKPEYLSFLVTMGHAPVLYVHGNHDDRYAVNPPEGCDCIDGQLVDYKGLRIIGLGGSRRYSPGENQYTERQMWWRIHKLHIKAYQGVDIILTHAPVEGYGDLPDLPHKGFRCFQKLILLSKPLYLLHGHVHIQYYYGMPRTHQMEDTTIVNVCNTYLLEIPDELIRQREKQRMEKRITKKLANR